MTGGVGALSFRLPSNQNRDDVIRKLCSETIQNIKKSQAQPNISVMIQELTTLRRNLDTLLDSQRTFWPRFYAVFDKEKFFS